MRGIEGLRLTANASRADIGRLWGASAPSTAPAGRGLRDRDFWHRVALVVGGLVLVGVVGACGAGPDAQPTSTPGVRPTSTAIATAGLGSRQQGIDFFNARGFAGRESPLNDGRQRWLLSGPNSFSAELIGPPADLTEVSLTVVAGGPGGTLIGEWLGRYAPTGGNAFLQAVLDDAQLAGDQDQSRDLGDRSLRILTLRATDGALIILTVEEE